MNQRFQGSERNAVSDTPQHQYYMSDYYTDDEGRYPYRRVELVSSRSVVGPATNQPKHAVVYPWGVNPVLINRIEPVQLQATPITEDRLRVPSYNVQSSSMFERSDEFVNTNSIGVGFEPLVEVIRSFIRYIVGSSPYPHPPSSDDSDSDIEIGLRTVAASATTQANDPGRLSAFDVLHSDPIRFPSSIDELVGGPPPISLKKAPIPGGDPPSIPPLPVPLLRNEG